MATPGDDDDAGHYAAGAAQHAIGRGRFSGRAAPSAAAA